MPPQSTERRILTVLFSDLSGFTSLSEQMDPEDVTEIIDALFRLLRTAIEAQGGTVDKFIGDAVMAVFGAPTAHADDPLRAVRAGIAMQAAVAAFNRERGLSLALRIGINTGEALWGSVAGDRPTAMGDAVNVAQRMESAARPGSVLVTQAVERATFRSIEYRFAGDVLPKGRTEPVKTFEALSVKAAAETPGGGFFGREAELAKLLEQHAGGKGVFVLIEGEGGIGKTRLAAELLAKVGPACWTATGRAPEGGKAPLGALADLVRHAAGSEPPASWLAATLPASLDAGDREIRSQLLALSIGAGAAGPRLAALDPSRAADETRNAWVDWLRARSPAALCLDDMENADPALLALLGSLPPRLAGTPVTILLTARRGLETPAGFEKVELGPLGAEALAGLAADALGRTASPELCAFLRERTGGSPFYVAQLARWLDNEGYLEGSPARLARRPEKLPDGLQALLVARLDTLEASPRDAVKTASVLGRSFWRGVLSELAGREASPDIAAAEREDVVEPRPASLLPGDAEYAFRQSLLQEAAYSLLTKKDRARLHGAAATALESRTGRPARSLAARQRDLEGKPAEAAKLWLDVAREALTGKAWDEAAAAGHEAVRLGAGPEAALIELKATIVCGRGEPVETLLARIEADPAASREQKAEAAFAVALWAQRARSGQGTLDAAEHAAQVAGAPSPDLRALRIVGLIAVSRFEEGVAEAETLLAESAGDDAPSRLRRARGLISRGQIYQRWGRYDPALADYREAIDALRQLKDSTLLASALRALAVLLRNVGRLEEALAANAEAVELFRSTGDRGSTAATLVGRVSILRVMGRRDEAMDCAKTAEAMTQDLGLAPALAALQITLGNLLSDEGNHTEAEKIWFEALDLTRQTGDRATMAILLANIANSRMGEGDRAAARPLLEECIALHRATGERRHLIGALNTLAHAELRDGSPDRARLLLEESLALADALGRRSQEGWALVVYATALLELGQAARCDEILTEALAFIRADTPGGRISALILAADIRHRQGRTAEEEACLRESIAAAREAGTPGRAINALITLSRLVETRDLAESRALASEARQAVASPGSHAVACAREAAAAAKMGDAAKAAEFAREARAGSGSVSKEAREGFETDLAAAGK